MKGRIQQEDTALENIYAPNGREPIDVKQILMDMDREIDSNTIIVGDFNTPWTSMNKSSDRKTTGKQESNSTLDQIDLINI